MHINNVVSEINCHIPRCYFKGIVTSYFIKHEVQCNEVSFYNYTVTIHLFFIVGGLYQFLIRVEKQTEIQVSVVCI